MLKICNREDFIRNEQYEAVFCFGAGKYSKLVAEEFAYTIVMNRIVCFVDNDVSKEGSKISLAGFEYRVCTPSIFRKYRNRKVAVIISCKNVTEILEQLVQNDNLQLADFYYIQHFILADKSIEAMKKEVPANLRLSEKPLIPKVIHYCWFGHNPIPDKYKAWMESWHKFCPDYEIKEWNESNYDITKNKYMYQAYEQKKWGFVPDYARLDIIYNHGGIYLDTDVEIVSNFDELLYQKGFAGFESEKFVALGLGFGAMPKLPIIKEMMDFYEDKQFVNEDGTLNLIASPVLQTDFLLKHGLVQDGEYQVVDDLTIFPEKAFCGKNLQTRLTMLKPYSRSIHHYDASWIDDDAPGKKWAREREALLELGENQEIWQAQANNNNVLYSSASYDTKVSVIVIVYNVESYLEQCVQSITKQSYSNLEIILVDDGSTDCSGSMCDNFASQDARIKVIHKSNGGLVSARQAGIKAATGEYVTFVDGDDWIDSNMYEVLCDFAITYQPDVVLSAIMRNYPTEEKRGYNLIPNGYYDKLGLEENVYPKMMFSLREMNHHVDPSLCNKLFRREYITKAILAEDTEIFYLGEDAAATYPCLLNVNSIFVTERAFYHHRIIPVQRIDKSSYKYEHIYERLERFYVYLNNVFEKTKYKDILKPQLSAYYLVKLDQVTAQHIGINFLQTYNGALWHYTKDNFLSTLFSSMLKVVSADQMQYGLQTKDIPKNNKIVLYGAGAVGKSYIMQLHAEDYEVVAWVDKDAERLSIEGWPVKGLDELEKCRYDIVLVAAKRAEMFESMKRTLLANGVEKDRIVWYPPIERQSNER